MQAAAPPVLVHTQIAAAVHRVAGAEPSLEPKKPHAAALAPEGADAGALSAPPSRGCMSWSVGWSPSRGCVSSSSCVRLPRLALVR